MARRIPDDSMPHYFPVKNIFVKPNEAFSIYSGVFFLMEPLSPEGESTVAETTYFY